jgi:NADH dehydrogenase FAD-containing subunit
MPIYSQGLHDAIVERCEALGVRLILGERVLEWPENPGVLDGKTKVVKTSKGTEITGDLVLVCTGTKPTVKFMKQVDPNTIASNGCIRVKDTLQIRTEGGSDNDGSKFDNLFAIGDCADTTAIRAGHMAFAMGGVASRNILRLIDAHEKNETPDLESYDPSEPIIKVTLGLVSREIMLLDWTAAVLTYIRNTPVWLARRAQSSATSVWRISVLGACG